MGAEPTKGDRFIESYIRFRNRLVSNFTTDMDSEAFNNLHNTAFYAATLDHVPESGELEEGEE